MVCRVSLTDAETPTTFILGLLLLYKNIVIFPAEALPLKASLHRERVTHRLRVPGAGREGLL